MMRKESRLKQQRVPAPKSRREPLPVEISVKHHLPIGAEGTATDLTVAEMEARSVSPLEYSTSQVQDFKQPPLIKADRDKPKHRKSGKRVAERRLEEIDLNVGKSFVRVPNAVADRLARQLSPAEEKIFDQIWRLTVGYNRETWRGKISDLMLRTGYSSRATVTKAIAGLSALNLITVEGRETNPKGRIYRISDRAQLLDYQKEGRLLDQSIKKSSTTQAKSGRVVERVYLEDSLDLQDIPATYGHGKKTSRVFKDRIERNDDSASSSSWRDDETAKQIRLTYQDLTGNHWGVTDESALSEIAHIPLPFIILGICYSITRVAEHRIGSLKYCIPSIREHYEIMKGFDHKDLVEIAYRHLVRVKEAQRSGRWTSA
ncbi:MAG: replication protein [Candidatus Bathyarchaeia archaeon]